MAGDSAITVIELTGNAFSDHTGAVSVLNSTAAATIDVSDLDPSKLLIFVDRDSGSAKNPTIVIEDGGYYSAGAVGNVTQLTTVAGEYVFAGDGTRWTDTSEKINISKTTTDTTIVYVSAILLP